MNNLKAIWELFVTSSYYENIQYISRLNDYLLIEVLIENSDLLEIEVLIAESIRDERFQ